MLTEKETKNFMKLAANYTPRDMAGMLNEDIDCDNCPIKSRCPVSKEYEEFERYGWWRDPVNTCIDTMENYIRTGMIRDKRKEKKDDEDSRMGKND
jgi:hypothetical protein